MGLLSEGTYDVVIEQFGPVELDRQSEYFMGSRKKTNHTGELEALGHGMLILLDRWEPHVAIMYDAAGDAAAFWCAWRGRAGDCFDEGEDSFKTLRGSHFREFRVCCPACPR